METKKLEPLQLNGRFAPPWDLRSRPLVYSNCYAEVYDDPQTPHELQVGILHQCRWEHVELLTRVGSEVEPVAEQNSSLRHIARRQLLRLVREGIQYRRHPFWKTFEFYTAHELHCPTSTQDQDTVAAFIGYALDRSCRNVQHGDVEMAQRAFLWMERWHELRDGAFIAAIPALVAQCNAVVRRFHEKPFGDAPQLAWKGWPFMNFVGFDNDGVIAALTRPGSTRMPTASRRAMERDWQRVLQFVYRHEPIKDSKAVSEILFAILYLGGRLQVKLKETGLI